MARFYLLMFAGFGALKALSVLVHFLGPSPWGGPLVLSPDRFIPEALTIELGLISGLTVLFAIVERLAVKASERDMARPVVRGGALGVMVVWMLFGQIDYEVVRWIGQHMSLSYVLNFAGGDDPKLLKRILKGDMLWVGVGFVQWLVASLLAVGLWFRFRHNRERVELRGHAMWIGFTVIALASPAWLRPSEKRWRRIRPAQVAIGAELWNKVSGGNEPANPVRADKDLRAFAVMGNIDAEAPPPKEAAYPLYRDDNVGKIAPEDFKSLPREQRPDVVYIVFETLRGWNSGFLEGGDDLAHMPRLKKRLTEEALVFPRMHSVGYPSVEGCMGMHLGMWPHHTGIVFSDYLHTQTIAFPEMLRAGGYKAFALLGADPSFSNFTPWFRRWYDAYEFDPKNNHDRPLVDRFVELYDEAKADADPRLWMLWSATTHPPYDVPEHSGMKPAATTEERYAQAMTYADAEIERLIAHLEADPRWSNTVVLLLGDHGQPTPWQWRHDGVVGELSPGHTWTTLAILGGHPSVPKPGRDERAITHNDIAPTLLSMLNLKHGNHFFGRDLLRDQGERPVLAFRYGTVSHEIADTRRVFRMDSDGAIAYRFDRDDARSYGALEESAIRPLSQDSFDYDRYRDMALYWSQLLDEDRLAPPEAKPELSPRL